MLARLALRRLDGVPPAPKQHPALEWLARAVHAGLYLDLIGAPIVGVIAYFFLPSFAGLHHLMARQILVVLFALHFAGALWHWLVARDGVMTRMASGGPDNEIGAIVSEPSGVLAITPTTRPFSSIRSVASACMRRSNVL